jgi:hypothetical protein
MNHRLRRTLGLGLAAALLGAVAADARPSLFELDPIPNQTAKSWQAFSYTVRYQIVDEACFDYVAFSLDSKPAGMAIDVWSGRITWTPTPSQENQTFSVVVRAIGFYLPGSPCYGGSTDRTASFLISVTPGIQDQDADGISDPLETTLINRFAPVVRLHPSDENRPSTVEWYLARTHMRFHHSGCSDDQILNKGAVTVANVSTQAHQNKGGWPGCGHSGQSWQYSGTATPNSRFFLQIPNDSSEYTTRLGAPSGSWKCYAHVRRAAGAPTEYDVQYWFFYPYNGQSSWGFGAHEGDWEHVTVRVYSDGTTIDKMYFSAHEGEGDWYFPYQLYYSGGRPVAYSAWHTHASYPWPGTWVRTNLPDDQTANGGPQWDCLSSLVNVGEYGKPLNGQSWLLYSGRWGEIGEIFSGPWGPAYQSKWNAD